MLNKALKQIRAFHQLKQTELADMLDISNSYLCEIESGRKPVSMDLLLKYSEVFSIPASSLLLFSENYENAKASSGLRLQCAEKVLKAMEWVSAKYEFKKD